MEIIGFSIADQQVFVLKHQHSTECDYITNGSSSKTISCTDAPPNAGSFTAYIPSPELYVS
jgi:hypothetical protein